MSKLAWDKADEPRARALPISYVKVDGVFWRAMRLSEGRFVWEGSCVCGALLITDDRQIKPAAVRCAVCRTWARLP